MKEIQVVFTRKKESRSRRISSVSNTSTDGGRYPDHRVTDECRMTVDNVLGNVSQLTLLQSEDPGWFLARAFMFTSRTSHGFMRAFAGNYEANLKGISYTLAGKVISRLTNPLSQDVGDVEQKLNSHWSAVLDACNIQKGATESDGDSDASATIMSISENDLNDMRKDVNLLSKVGKRASSSLRKPQLVQRVLDLQTQVSNGTEVLQVDAPEELSAEEKSQKRARELVASMYMASLESWVMKPLTATAGMKEDTINEVQVLNALPPFFDENDIVAWTPQLSSKLEGGIFVPRQKLTVHHVRSVGLLSSHSNEMVADSPDGLIGISNEDGHTFCAAVEIKTMASPRTVEQARKVKEKFGAFTELKDIGTLDANTEGFHILVPKTEYRLQCLHHAVALGLKRVLLVVGKGSSMGIGSGIYSVLLNFSESIRNSYSFCLDCIRVSSLKWVGGDASMIPKEYDNMLQSSHASDLCSFFSFYNLSCAYRELVYKRGPLLPARMIRPTVLVSWNALKGGMDEFSRALTSLAYTNASENPIVGVIGRLICAQVNNAAVVYRLSLAKMKGFLPDSVEESDLDENSFNIGYASTRNKVTRCLTFGDFARGLAKEYHELDIATHERERIDAFRRVRQSDISTGIEIKPMYFSDAARKYNRPTDRARRLNGSDAHRRVKGKATYCCLCSFNFTWKYNGKKYTKKGGSKERQWCELCRQAVCSHCWDEWHSAVKLSRAVIFRSEMESFKEKVRSRG